MMQEKLQNEENTNFLRSQIEFFKEELREKNKMITSLLQDKNSFKIMETGRLYCNEQEHNH